MLGRPAAWLGAFVLLIALAGLLWKKIPTAFIPTEDKGYMAMSVQLPDAASLQRTEATVANIEKIIRTEPAVVNIVALVGLDLLSQSSSTNGATIFLNLKPWDERGKHDALDAIAERINGKLFAMRDAMAFGFNLPEVPGLGSTAGVEINLQNRSGQDIREFAQHVQEFRQAANQLPAAAALNSTFRANVPQVFVTVDRTAAKARGVNLTDLFATLQAFLSSLYINDFNLFGKTYRVQAEAQQQFRQTPERHRPVVRARHQQPDGAGVGADDDELSQRAVGDLAVQRIHVGAVHRRAEARAQHRASCSTRWSSSCRRSSRRRGSACRTPGSRFRSARRAATRRWCSCSDW